MQFYIEEGEDTEPEVWPTVFTLRDSREMVSDEVQQPGLKPEVSDLQDHKRQGKEITRSTLRTVLRFPLFLVTWVVGCVVRPLLQTLLDPHAQEESRTREDTRSVGLMCCELPEGVNNVPTGVDSVFLH